MFGSSATTALCISEPSRVGEARRLAVAMAGSLGFAAPEAGKVSIVVTEAANNIVKHARNGELLLRALECEGVPGLEMLALDKGPGMADLERCFQDGYSTAGSAGTGLGAVMRLAQDVDVYSRPQHGTAVLCRFWARPPKHRKLQVQVGGVAVPVEGEQLCGDAWAAVEHPDRSILMVADGLGHGQYASEAAEQAVRVFHENAHRSPAEIIEYAHGALRSTRGAALALAEIDLRRPRLRFAGIGNIAATILNRDTVRNLVSHNGTVGHGMRKLQELEYPWPPESLLIMNSDGLTTRWNLDNFPGIRQRHPTVIAGLLYRDFKRGRDDVTVLAARGIVDD